MAASEPRTRFLELRRATLDEGGVRITVVLGGGPPPSLVWDREKCAGCWACVAACPEAVRTFDDSGPVLEPGRCTLCCACVEACPTGALECTERRWTVAELAHEILADRQALRRPGGGVTVAGSGEELRSAFARELVERLGDAGVETTLGGSG